MRWKAAVLAMGVLAAGCQEDPFDFGQPRNCEIASQNDWVYDLMLNAYLWAEEVPDVDPRSFEDPETMVSEIRYQEIDRWSRISDLETTEALFEEGKVIGLGIRMSRDADNRVVLSFVNRESPADNAGLRRGDVLLSVAGQTIEQIDETDAWDTIFGENLPGVVVDLSAETGGETQELTITKDWYPLITVPYTEVFEVGGRNVGYLVFTTFVEPSVPELDSAFAQFKEAGVQDVIVDMRYNSGGRISAAHHLMNLLVGAAAGGEVAYKVDYAGILNDEDSSRALYAVNETLPAINQVVFITTGSTLSASELVINGVRPHVDVKIVGGRTGGKPVGSRQWEFCDKVAHPITFRLLNAENFGDYFDGFAADCEAADDFFTPLASAEEASIAAALALIDGRACPALAGPEELQLDPQAPRGAYRGLPELRATY